jgi:hypothetical protein
MFRGEVIGIFDNADGICHELRPLQLIGSEHDAVFEAGFYEALDVAIDFL